MNFYFAKLPCEAYLGDEMIKLFKKPKKTKKSKAPAYLGPAEGAYVIGDIHGCFDKMISLLKRIREDIGREYPNISALSGEDLPKIIFLGDLVDRGPKSKEVIESLMSYKPSYARPIFLAGNHEEVFLKVLEGDLSSLRFWYKFGGRECMRSYGVTNLGQIHHNPESLLHKLQGRVPRSHFDFISSFQNYYLAGDYLCVHAGIKPKVPLDRQDEKDFRWIRDTFLQYKKPHPYRVIHGHTISEEPENLPNRIGVDTGGYKGNPLTAVFIRNETVRFIQSETFEEPSAEPESIFNTSG